MTRRNSPKDIATLTDLTRLADVVVNKRNDKRADEKKNRRNRHYETQFIRQAVTRGLPVDEDDSQPS